MPKDFEKLRKHRTTLMMLDLVCDANITLQHADSRTHSSSAPELFLSFAMPLVVAIRDRRLGRWLL